jgi:hypothetical protein
MCETQRMKNWLIIPLAAASLGAAAQTPAGKAASKSENAAVTEIVQCMVAGLPEGWSEAVMVIALAKPGDETGAVEYLMSRGPAAAPTERFTPCDVRVPAMRLIEARKELPAARRGWIGARLSILHDGKFSLKYEYPK